MKLRKPNPLLVSLKKLGLTVKCGGSGGRVYTSTYVDGSFRVKFYGGDPNVKNFDAFASIWERILRKAGWTSVSITKVESPYYHYQIFSVVVKAKPTPFNYADWKNNNVKPRRPAGYKYVPNFGANPKS